jgi:WD40 repeat protein
VGAAFSADGRTAVTAGEDKRVIVWNVERAAARETLEGHAGQITGLAISRDGRTLHTAALDGNVLIWDLAGTRRLGRPFDTVQAGQGEGADFDPPSYALRPDGRVLAVGHNDGTVTLIDVRTLRAQSTFRAVPTGPVQGMAYVPRSRLLLIGGDDDGFLALFDPRRGKLIKALPGHRGPLGTPSFSADGRLMATVGGYDEVLVWTLKAGQPLGRPRRYYPSLGGEGVSLSPDGRTLAVTTALGIEIIDVATRRRRTLLPRSETVKSLARFTPDGRFIVGASTDGWARLWSTDTWQPATRLLAGHTGEVIGQSTSPDAHTLATGSTDGTIRLFDLRTQRPLGEPLPGLANRLVAPEFTPDGAYLLAITGEGRAYRWDVRPSSWARHACAVAGRQLTRSEWADALPERDYNPAC